MLGIVWLRCLLLRTAGGEFKAFDMELMIANGGEVVTGGPGVFAELGELGEL